MSPATGTQKSASAKSGKLEGKEFEETFKPKSRDSTAKELENKKGKEGKKGKKSGTDGMKKSGFPKILIFIMIIVVLLGGAGAALYFSGNLTKIFNNALSAVGLQIISSDPTSDANVSGEPAATDATPAATSDNTTITPVQPDISEVQPSVSGLPDASPPSAPVSSPAAKQTFEEIRAGFSEEKLAELKKIGAIYTKMDPAAAAAIMTKIYDTQQIAVIVYFMQPASSALVLAKLDTALAADVTQLLAS